MKNARFSDEPGSARPAFRIGAWGMLVSALAVACSFGQVDGGENSTPLDPPDENPPDGQGQKDDETPGIEPGPGLKPPTTDDPPSVDAPYDPDGDPFSTEMGKQVKAILQTNCQRCHVGAGAQGQFGYLFDMDQLITTEKIVPGNKEDSELYVRMVGGSMPPAAERAVSAPSYGDIETVGLFIDQLERPDPQGSCEPLKLLDNDQQIELMRADMADQDPQDRVFTRYLTINYSSNGGQCGRALQRQRFALFKGINSVSTNTRVTQPEAIDKDQTIYRIDIRDYGWDRAIDLEDNDIEDAANIDFADGWEAIINDPRTAAYAVEYTGDAADDLSADAGTRVPFMPVNAFIQATEFGDLYYALIGAKRNLFAFEREVLLIDTATEIADNRLMRAGFANSGVSKQERVLNRFDSGVAAGQSYWISFDFDGGNGGDGANGFERDVANESIFADPLDFTFAGGEAIFSLPNGMQGYYVAAANGDRLGVAPIGVVIDPAQNNGLVTNGASCHSCHNAGMITFTDTVRQFVEDNSVRFDRETYEDVMEQYPDSDTWKAQMNRDSAMHLRATTAAGVPEGTPDPISRVYLDFQKVNLDLALAAGELGVTPEVLRDSLPLLDPRLINLGEKGGYVAREIMDDTFLDSLCVLSSAQENTPANCQ